LLGDPVEHSLSPAVHNAALAERGLDAVYVALRCSRDRVGSLMRGLAEAGGGGNVTLPHKRAAFAALDDAAPAAAATGACNTFWLEDGALRGDNTDVAGFGAAAGALLGDPETVGRALVLGAGGAARAAVAWLADAAAEVVVANRTPGRARALVEAVGRDAVRAGDPYRDGPFDLVVNATSLGLRPDDDAPVDLARLGGTGAVLDLTYAAAAPALASAAALLGIAYGDGREMLVRQAAEAFRLWWRADPPLEAMRKALAPS
jgi:shikimate dehydrogenase